jgi:16S rRNA (guanine(966)-N(2))-methyltransferase RsmD
MRVIGGEYRSRRLKTLPGRNLRPTPDRLRETLFDVIAAEVPGSVFLDAYAGSGAVGIEALSRGAARAIFLERHRPAVALIRDNLKALGLEAKAVLVPGSVLGSLARFAPDIAFLDPPYDLEREYGEALHLLGQQPPPLVVAQHSARFELRDRYGRLVCTRTLRQGDNILSFYTPPGAASDLHID